MKILKRKRKVKAWTFETSAPPTLEETMEDLRRSQIEFEKGSAALRGDARREGLAPRETA